MSDKAVQLGKIMDDTQKEANIDIEVLGKRIQVNEQTTIQELDEIIYWLNGMIGRNERLIEVKRAIYQFMRQHHTFDLYIDDVLRSNHSNRSKA